MEDLIEVKRRGILYAAFKNGAIAELPEDGKSKREIPLKGKRPGEINSLAMDPLHERLWAADDALDQVWSFDPGSGEGRLEFTFIREKPGIEAGRGAAIAFGPGSLAFSEDGKRLTVSDEAGWIWTLERQP